MKAMERGAQHVQAFTKHILIDKRTYCGVLWSSEGLVYKSEPPFLPCQWTLDLKPKSKQGFVAWGCVHWLCPWLSAESKCALPTPPLPLSGDSSAFDVHLWNLTHIPSSPS